MRGDFLSETGRNNVIQPRHGPNTVADAPVELEGVVNTPARNMVHQDALLVERNIFGLTRVGGQNPFFKADQILRHRHLKVETGLLNDAFRIAELHHHPLFPLANRKRRLGGDKDQDQAQPDN